VKGWGADGANLEPFMQARIEAGRRAVNEPLPFPLTGQPPCAKHSEQKCLRGCEYGIRGPCLREPRTQGDTP